MSRWTPATAQLVLNGRYELGPLIAEGGMAQVYQGRDRALDRDVAIKILRPQFAASPEFLDRFRREARVAASLTHPNLVNVFDVGEDAPHHYIVMELLPGKTLKDLGGGRALPLDRAVDLTRQIALGMAHAHRRGLVHRDLKPQNVLITEDGHAKVADFGLAQAAEAADLTVPGTVWGTVQYISPEQAQGLPATIRSDIYALGAIFYELLTGKVPYAGETPAAIMVKHVYDPPPAARDVVPSLPVAAEQVVQRAMAKHPDQRFQSMDEVVQVLNRLRDSAEAETTLWATMPAPISRPALTAGVDDRTRVIGPAAPPVTSPARVTRPGPYPAPSRGRVPPVRRHRTPAWLPVALAGSVLAFFALMAVGAYAARQVLPRSNLARPTATARVAVVPTATPPPPTATPTPIPQVPVPNVLGQPLPTAQARLEAVGLTWETVEEHHREVPAGAVASQEPQANARLEQGRAVRLVVSKGPQKATVPSVIGDPFSVANEKLTRAGFVVDRQDAYNSQAERGIVFAQSPARDVEADVGSRVTVRVSLGREQAVVPQVLGQTEEQARERLARDGFNVEVTYEPSSAVEPGVVFVQDPLPNAQVDRGSVVRIRVRRDPTPIPATATPVPPTHTPVRATATVLAPSATPAAQQTRPAGNATAPAALATPATAAGTATPSR